MATGKAKKIEPVAALFLILMYSDSFCNSSNPDPNLPERLSRRVVNNNESILKIDCALSEKFRFEHHNHQDKFLILRMKKR